MKKMNKKGFTIVELVIVIAVIAILAAVMIPTFSGIIDKANKSAAEQEAAALWKETYALDLSDGELDGRDNGTAIDTVSGEDVTYTVDEDGTIDFSFVADNGYTAEFDGSKWTIEK